MATETDICNFALGRLEVGKTISSIDDTDHVARTCKRWFAQCRDEVLEDFPWDFAMVAEALAQVAGQSFPGWTYVYQYPQECLAVRTLGPESGIRVVQNTVFVAPYDIYQQPQQLARYPWRVALKADGASKVILTDLPEAWVFYTRRVTNPAVFPPSFISTLSWKLASEIGGPIKADERLMRQAFEAYQMMKLNAQANSLNQARDDREADSPSIQSRL